MKRPSKAASNSFYGPATVKTLLFFLSIPLSALLISRLPPLASSRTSPIVTRPSLRPALSDVKMIGDPPVFAAPPLPPPPAPSPPTPPVSTNWVLGLRRHARSVHSQGLQDGIIEEIFRHIEPNSRTFVEFGFGYADVRNIAQSLYGTNTYHLTKQGWNGMLFDAVFEHPPIKLYKELLTPKTIVPVFRKRGVPSDVDYVSIDVDSVDLWLLQALLNSTYRPTLISIEHNSNFPYDAAVTVDRRWVPWQGDVVYGASIAALANVAEKAGYDPVYIERYLDVFFVRRDRLETSGGKGLTMQQMKEMFPMPIKLHGVSYNSNFSRFVDFDALQRTGDEDLASKEAVKYTERVKDLHRAM